MVRTLPLGDGVTVHKELPWKCEDPSSIPKNHMQTKTNRTLGGTVAHTNLSAGEAEQSKSLEPNNSI